MEKEVILSISATKKQKRRARGTTSKVDSSVVDICDEGSLRTKMNDESAHSEATCIAGSFQSEKTVQINNCKNQEAGSERSCDAECSKLLALTTVAEEREKDASNIADINDIKEKMEKEVILSISATKKQKRRARGTTSKVDSSVVDICDEGSVRTKMNDESAHSEATCIAGSFQSEKTVQINNCKNQEAGSERSCDAECSKLLALTTVAEEREKDASNIADINDIKEKMEKEVILSISATKKQKRRARGTTSKVDSSVVDICDEGSVRTKMNDESAHSEATCIAGSFQSEKTVQINNCKNQEAGSERSCDAECSKLLALTTVAEEREKDASNIADINDIKEKMEKEVILSISATKKHKRRARGTTSKVDSSVVDICDEGSVRTKMNDESAHSEATCIAGSFQSEKTVQINNCKNQEAGSERSCDAECSKLLALTTVAEEREKDASNIADINDIKEKMEKEVILSISATKKHKRRARGTTSKVDSSVVDICDEGSLRTKMNDESAHSEATCIAGSFQSEKTVQINNCKNQEAGSERSCDAECSKLLALTTVAEEREKDASNIADINDIKEKMENEVILSISATKKHKRRARGTTSKVDSSVVDICDEGSLRTKMNDESAHSEATCIAGSFQSEKTVQINNCKNQEAGSERSCDAECSKLLALATVAEEREKDASNIADINDIKEKMENEVILSISATKKHKRRARGTTSKVDSSVVDICDEGSLRTKMNDESAHSEATCIAGSFQSEKTVQINNCKNQEAGSERSCDAECSKLLALATVAEEREKDASNIADINDIKEKMENEVILSISATKKHKRRARGTTSKVDSSVVDICDEGSLRTKMNDESAHSEATCIAGSFQSEKTVQINNCKNQEAGSERSCDAECSKLLALATVAEEREKDASNIADINDIKEKMEKEVILSISATKKHKRRARGTTSKVDSSVVDICDEGSVRTKMNDESAHSEATCIAGSFQSEKTVQINNCKNQEAGSERSCDAECSKLLALTTVAEEREKDASNIADINDIKEKMEKEVILSISATKKHKRRARGTTSKVDSSVVDICDEGSVRTKMNDESAHSEATCIAGSFQSEKTVQINNCKNQEAGSERSCDTECSKLLALTTVAEEREKDASNIADINDIKEKMEKEVILSISATKKQKRRARGTTSKVDSSVVDICDEGSVRTKMNDESAHSEATCIAGSFQSEKTVQINNCKNQEAVPERSCDAECSKLLALTTVAEEREKDASNIADINDIKEKMEKEVILSISATKKQKRRARGTTSKVDSSVVDICDEGSVRTKMNDESAHSEATCIAGSFQSEKTVQINNCKNQEAVPERSCDAECSKLLALTTVAEEREKDASNIADINDIKEKMEKEVILSISATKKQKRRARGTTSKVDSSVVDICDEGSVRTKMNDESAHSEATCIAGSFQSEKTVQINNCKNQEAVPERSCDAECSKLLALTTVAEEREKDASNIADINDIKEKMEKEVILSISATKKQKRRARGTTSKVDSSVVDICDEGSVRTKMNDESAHSEATCIAGSFQSEKTVQINNCKNQEAVPERSCDAECSKLLALTTVAEEREKDASNIADINDIKEKMEKEVILSISATKKQKRRARGTTSKVDSSVVDICDEGSVRTKMNDESAHSEATCIAGSFQSEKTVQINNCKNQEAVPERSCDAECSKLLALTTVAEEREKDASNIADINDIKEDCTDKQTKIKVKEGSQILSQLSFLRPVIDRRHQIVNKYEKFSDMVKRASEKKGSCFKPHRVEQEGGQYLEKADGTNANYMESQCYNSYLSMDQAKYYYDPLYGGYQFFREYSVSQMPQYYVEETAGEFQQEDNAHQSEAFSECGSSRKCTDSSNSRDFKESKIEPEIRNNVIFIPNHFDSYETSGDTQLRITQNGLISVCITGTLDLLASIDGAVVLKHLVHNMAICVKKDGKSIAFDHPNGLMYAGPKEKLFMGYHESGEHRQAKITDNEVVFKKTSSVMLYCLDVSGTHSSYKNFEIKQIADFMKAYFYGSAKHGPQYIDEAQNILDTTFRFWQEDEVGDVGKEMCFTVGNMMISMSKNGGICMSKTNSNEWALEACLKTGSLTYRSRTIELTGSVREKPRMYFKYRNKSVTYNGNSLMAVNGSRSSGFNNYGKFVLVN